MSSIYAMNGVRVYGCGCGGGYFGWHDRVNSRGCEKGFGEGGDNYKVINGVDISNPNILFANKAWSKPPVWARH